MGCDIHFRVEKKVKGVWKEVPGPMRTCFGCDGDGKKRDQDGTVTEEKCYWCKGHGRRREEFYEGRNYQLFSILAGVRDYGGVKPIKKPKGFPRDASDTVKRRYRGWGGDAHSPSWYSLKEMRDFDWSQKAGFVAGIITIKQFKELKESGKEPESYCQGIGGPNIRVVDEGWAQEQLLVEKISLKEGEKSVFEDGVNYHVRAAWGKPYKDMADKSFLKVLDEMEAIAKKAKLKQDQIRMVFWFDN